MSITALVGYDGSRRSAAVIEAGAALFPAAHGWITHLWTPPGHGGAEEAVTDR